MGGVGRDAALFPDFAALESSASIAAGFPKMGGLLHSLCGEPNVDQDQGEIQFGR